MTTTIGNNKNWLILKNQFNNKNRLSTRKKIGYAGGISYFVGGIFFVSSTLPNSNDAMVQKHSLTLTHSSLALSQIPLQNFLFVTQNSQALRFLLIRNRPSQFLQQITIIFLQFFTSLNLMIPNLLERLLNHLIFCFFQ